jgi:hypothetical protein
MDRSIASDIESIFDMVMARLITIDKEYLWAC